MTRAQPRREGEGDLGHSGAGHEIPTVADSRCFPSKGARRGDACADGAVPPFKIDQPQRVPRPPRSADWSVIAPIGGDGAELRPGRTSLCARARGQKPGPGLAAGLAAHAWDGAGRGAGPRLRDSCRGGGRGGGSVNRTKAAPRLPVTLRTTREEPWREMEAEQEQRRRKVEAGRAKVNGGASPFRCPGVDSYGRAPVPATAPSRERTRSGEARRRALALPADSAGSRLLAAAILNPPPSARTRPRRGRIQSAVGDARSLARRPDAGHVGTLGAAPARGTGVREGRRRRAGVCAGTPPSREAGVALPHGRCEVARV